jgi:co-chaperonin GroES (HSP10)
VVHEEPTTAGGLYIPDFEERLLNEGVVVSTGERVEKVHPGERVMFDQYDGTQLPKDDNHPTKTFLVLREEFITAVIGEEDV